MMPFFAGVAHQYLTLSSGDVRLRQLGDGPPLLLLHGNPQTHAMWHQVAPVLAQHFTVICPDIRGYGVSAKPPASQDSSAYSKRAMAADLLEMMDQLGHQQFTVVAHDRGARIAHRVAIDHPHRVAKLAVLDIVPTLEHFERTDMEFALAYAHWFYLAMPAPFPEDMIGADPENWFRHHCGRPKPPEVLFHPEALSDYLSAINDPDVIRGICEDYRAAAGIDLEHDRASRADGNKITCPLLVLWGSAGIIGRFYDPIALWRAYCEGPVSGAPVEAGHYLAEEAPKAVLGHLSSFLLT